MFAYVRAVFGQFFTSDEAQDAFEYLLVVGAVSVAVIIAITTPIGTNLVNAIVTGVCDAVDAIGTASGGFEVNCTGLLGTGGTT